MPGCHTYVQQPGIRISGSSKPLFENEVLNRQILAGIPEDEIQLIFQAFYRATNTREYSGHGIGLGLSLKILSIYGARMEILSKLNTYTRVLITFK